ncbi:MAG: alkane 1-monooxygenase, partial [Candidatus Marinimicrobia bacterium]|nr:alkane 1-monooxygenase [Candidatus Neomarinimicrobiota bacterium]
MKYLKYFLMPILTLPLIVGIFLGGNWMWLGLSLLFLIVIVGDAVLGDDTSNPQY